MRLKSWRPIIALLVLATWTLGVKASPEELYEATYEGEYSGWDIEMTRSLARLEGNRYRFRSTAKNLFASITEDSLFEVVEGRIRPLRYEYARKIFGRSKDEVLDFDWQGMKVKYSKNGDSKKTVPLPQGEFTDPALYQLLLQKRFQEPQLSHATFDFIKRSRAKRYTFASLGDDELVLNGKSYPALGLERKDEDKQTKVWLLPQLDHVIGKLEHSDDGDVYTLELTEYRADRQALKAFYAAL